MQGILPWALDFVLGALAEEDLEAVLVEDRGAVLD